MKQIIGLMLGSAFLMSGCTYATDTMSQPPDIDWNVPEAIEANIEVDMMISLQSEEQEELKVNSFVLQKQGETETTEIPFEQDKEGNIEIQTSFDEEGIYNLRANIEQGNQTIRPSRQIVVGEVTEVDEKQEESDEEGHSDHH
jgi:hypothetical protein